VSVNASSTAFTIARNRTARVAVAVLGTQDGSIAVTDHFGSYDWIAASSRQVCGSYLRRDFQAMIDRGARPSRAARGDLAPDQRWHG
jgi:transposase